MKFAIITPTYNRVHTLERTINSILEQEYQNFEMIIVDDGSKDETSEFMEKYKDNPKIKYIQMTNNRGVNVARNVAFKNISKDVNYITLLDSDDEFFSHALNTMKEVIEKNKNYNYFRFAEIFKTGRKACYAKHDNLVADYRTTIEGKDAYGGWTVTLSRDIINNGFEFDERVNGFESLSWFELSKKEKCFYSLSVVKLYQTDTNSLTRPSKKDWLFYKNCKIGNELLLKTYGEDMKRFSSKELPAVLYELGKLNILFGERKKGIHYTINAIRYEPFNLRIFRNILKLFLPKIKNDTSN